LVLTSEAKDLLPHGDSRVHQTLFVTNDFGPRAGGIETFIIGLIERLPKNSVVVYTSAQENSKEYDEAWLRDFGVEVIRDRTKILLPTPRVARAIAKVSRKYQSRTACFGAAAPLALLAPTLRRSGVHHIVALTHGHEVWWAKVFPFSWAMRRIGSKVDSLTYLGEFTRNAISRALTPAARQAMVRVAPGIDIEHFAPLPPGSPRETLRQELGLENKKLIVSVGRLVHRKGQDKLLESLAIVRQSIPNAHVLLVGEGPYQRRLEEIAINEGVRDSVTFIGRVQFAFLPRYIRSADLFAMPSRSRFGGLEVEGLGIVYLEASACGIPVIGGMSGGAPDAVIDGVTGLVVDGTNKTDIADSIVKILSNPELGNTMGAAGRKWIVEQWAWEYWSRKFQEVLKI
jgi:phosphatidylinositol alpha-1,6-mannosyltransferase